MPHVFSCFPFWSSTRKKAPQSCIQWYRLHMWWCRSILCVRMLLHSSHLTLQLHCCWLVVGFLLSVLVWKVSPLSSTGPVAYSSWYSGFPEFVCLIGGKLSSSPSTSTSLLITWGIEDSAFNWSPCLDVVGLSCLFPVVFSGFLLWSLSVFPVLSLFPGDLDLELIDCRLLFSGCLYFFSILCPFSRDLDLLSSDLDLLLYWWLPRLFL